MIYSSQAYETLRDFCVELQSYEESIKSHQVGPEWFEPGVGLCPNFIRFLNHKSYIHPDPLRFLSDIFEHNGMNGLWPICSREVYLKQASADVLYLFDKRWMLIEVMRETAVKHIRRSGEKCLEK